MKEIRFIFMMICKSTKSNWFAMISSVEHVMVQGNFRSNDSRKEGKHEMKMKAKRDAAKIWMISAGKLSYDTREDFRRSMM